MYPYQYTFNFGGKFLHSLDGKNRLMVPAGMRDEMHPADDSTFMMTLGEGKYLCLYPKLYWPQVGSSMWGQYFSTEPHLQRMARRRQEYTEPVKMDPQGRITLPKQHMEFAGIDRDALILGMLVRIEIWAPNVYEQFMKEGGEEEGMLKFNLEKMDPYGPDKQRIVQMNPAQPGLQPPWVQQGQSWETPDTRNQYGNPGYPQTGFNPPPGYNR